MPDELSSAGALALVIAEIGELLDRTAARRIVGVTGPPGTGKSTFAEHLHDRLNTDHPSLAALLPMDGFHLANRQLERLGRRDRKGAPDTFDADGYVTALRRASVATQDVYVPEFDRRLDESVSAGLVIPADARVVITEGNYLGLPDGHWGSVRGVVDRMYYLDCAPQVRRRRLIERHVAGGRTQTDAQRWVDLVDAANAQLVADTEVRCDRTLHLVDERRPE